MFNDKDNANKVPALLQEIYSKVAGESADMKGIDEYPNDTKISMLLERIATALESGGGGGSTGGGTFVVTYDYTVMHTDKTWNEVKEAALAGKSVMLVTDGDGAFQYDLLVHMEVQSECFFANFSTNLMIADSADGYLYYAD